MNPSMGLGGDIPVADTPGEETSSPRTARLAERKRRRRAPHGWRRGRGAGAHRTAGGGEEAAGAHRMAGGGEEAAGAHRTAGGGEEAAGANRTAGGGEEAAGAHRMAGGAKAAKRDRGLLP